MPFFQQGLAVIIGRLCGVPQIIGRIAVHTGLASHHRHVAPGCCGKERIDALRVDGAKTGQRRGAMRQRKIQRPACHLIGIDPITKARFFGECIGIEPVNQLLAPARNHTGLRIMHMRIHKSRADQTRAIIRDRGIRVRRAQGRAMTCRGNPPAVDQDTAFAVEIRGIGPVAGQRIARKPKGLTKK